MKKWTRVAFTVTAAAIALLIGITSASSAPPTGSPTPPVAVPHQTVTAQDIPLVQHLSPRPPARGEGTYVAITPCRIVDTRRGGGKFNNVTTRTYRVGGSAGFAPQGGHSGGCGIPLGASAIAVNIGSTNADNLGYLEAYPANVSRPTSSNVNYSRGQTIAGGGTVTLQRGVAQSLKVFNFGGPTDVFIDVNGYYAQQIQGMIAPDGSVYSGTDRIVSATVLSPGLYRVTFDTDVTFCTPMIDVYAGSGLYGNAYAFAGTSVYVSTWNLSATTHLEVPHSYYFYITLTC